VDWIKVNPLLDFCEYGYEPSGLVKAGILHHLSVVIVLQCANRHLFFTFYVQFKWF